jgi:hypothetical protein
MDKCIRCNNERKLLGTGICHQCLRDEFMPPVNEKKFGYTARFIKNVFEKKYAIIPYFRGFSHRKDGLWELSSEHIGIGYSAGFKQNNVMRYERFVEEKVFYEDETSIILEVGNKVKLGFETVTITDVVRNLDGSIDYHTDKEDEIYLNTYDTFFDEREK